MVYVEHEIKRLEELYNIYTQFHDDSGNNFIRKIYKDIIAPQYERKLAELYAVKDMQKQHTHKPGYDGYKPNNKVDTYTQEYA